MKPPAFQFYPDDFVAGVSILSTEEIGAYMLLLCHQWSAGAVPDNDTLIRRIAKLSPDFDLTLIRQKFKSVGGGLQNERMELEREKQVAYRESRSANGKLGGRPCKAHDNHMVSQPKAYIKAKKSSPSPSPSPSPKDNSKPPAGDSNFAAFVKGWSEAFKSFHGFDYKFDGGKDGKATKDLMAMNLPILELLDVAKRAWAKNRADAQFSKACKESATIHGFRYAFNPIRVEVSNGQQVTPLPRQTSQVGQKAGETFEQYEQRVLKECVQ